MHYFTSWSLIKSEWRAEETNNVFQWDIPLISEFFSFKYFEDDSTFFLKLLDFIIQI